MKKELTPQQGFKNLGLLIKAKMILSFTVLFLIAGQAICETSNNLPVENIAGPVAICQNFTTFLDVSGTKTISPFNIEGGSFDPDGTIVDYILDQTLFTCDDLGDNIVTLTVVDNDGNTDTCQATVTITWMQQNFACLDQLTITLDQNGNASLSPMDVLGTPIFDPCGLMTVFPSSFDCTDIGVNTVIFEDGLGNSCFTEVNILDTTEVIIIYPMDIDVECGESTDPSSTGEPIIVDNCGSYATDFQDQVFPIINNTIKILRTWTILDSITGDVEQHLQIIKTVDTTAPQTICFSNVNISLDPTGNATITPEAIDAGSFDGCGNITLDISPTSFDCSDVGSTTAVFLTVTDESGNTSECWTSVTVEDKLSPIAICVNLLNVSLAADGTATITPEMIDAGSYDNCGPVTLSLSQSNFDCDDILNNDLTVFLTVTDESGNSSECWTSVNIEDKIPPVVTCPADITLDCSQADNLDPSITGYPTVVDNCDAIGTSYEDQFFDLGGSQLKVIRSWVIVDWYSGAFDSCVQVIKTLDLTSPEIVCFDQVTVALDNSGSLTLNPEDLISSASDACDSVSLSVSPNIFDCNSIGDNTVVVTATDGAGNSSFCVTTITIEDNTPPLAVCLGQINISLGTDGTATITPDVIDAGSYDNCGPVALSLSQSTFDCDDILNNDLTVFLTVTDESGNSSECWTSVNIEDKIPPVVTCPADITLDCSQADNLDPSITGYPTVVDNCDAIGTSYEDQFFDLGGSQLKVIRSWVIVDWYSGAFDSCVQVIKTLDLTSPEIVCFDQVTVALDNSGSLTLNPEDLISSASDACDSVSLSVAPNIFDCNSIGDNTVVVTATDGVGNSSFCFTTITIEDNTPPVAVCLGQINISLGTDGTATITPDVIDAGSYDNCGPVTLSLSQSTFDCDDILNNDLTVFLTVTDESGNSSECWTSVNIEDKIPPVVTCPADITVDCSQADNLDPAITGYPTVVDNCDAIGTSFEDQFFDLGGSQLKVIRSWVIVDWYSGAFDSCVQVIKILDLTSPEIVCFDQVTVALDNSGSLTLNPEDLISSASDACDSVSLSVAPSIFDCNSIGDNTVVVTATDGAGNSSFCVTTITIEDIINPVAICQSQVNVTLDTDGTATITPENIDAGSFDNCGPVTLSINQSMFDCSDILNDSLRVYLTVTDANGNTTGCWTEVTISGQDSDADGYTICNGDCDDNNATTSPNSPEICGDNIDNNCDGNIDENCICASFAQSTQYEWIETVATNDVSNNSGNDNGYGDYSSIVLSMNIGDNTMELIPGFSGGGYNEFWSVWIDLNHNGQYENSEEVLSQSSTSTINETINIHTTSLLGTTTMRVSMKYNQSSDPCEIFSEGEVEDYSVLISNPEYCESNGQDTQYEWIKKVRLKTINNLSGNDNGYADFTNLSTSLNPGQSKNIILKPGFSDNSYLEYWSVWVDWNEDGDFDDANELEVQISSTGNITDQITVPDDATSGNKIMRVSMNYNGYATPCEVFTYGEVEDYTILVTGSNSQTDQSSSTRELDTENKEINTMKINIYPNPASNIVNIELTSSIEPFKSITIYNQVGQLVYQAKTNLSQYSVDVSGSQFTNDMYTVFIQQGEEVITKKLIVAK